MTNELLQSGIDAIKDLNDLILKWATEGFNEKEGLIAQKDLSALTDVIQESLLDMVRADALKDKVKVMNEILSEHLNRFPIG